MRDLKLLLVVLAISQATCSEQMFAPQVVSQMMPSELESLASFGGRIPMVQPSFNGLPAVSASDAVNQFLARQEAIAQQNAATAAASSEPQLTDLEEDAKKSATRVLPGGLSPAVPKLQQWLTAMDPMGYSSPAYTNPVATQFFKRFASSSTSPQQREQMGRMVSSPYMFSMLGNPAFSDPQLWSGLVSGAGVPYPVRTTIMSQRTQLPFQVARTGSALTPTDQYAMEQYEEADQKAGGVPLNPHHAVRHSLFKVIQKLQNKNKSDKLKSLTSEKDFFATPKEAELPSLEERRPVQRRHTK